jgi:hypothetical protein
VVQQRDKDKAQKLTLPNILHIFFTMYTEKELEIISSECLNAKIQDLATENILKNSKRSASHLMKDINY